MWYCNIVRPLFNIATDAVGRFMAQPFPRFICDLFVLILWKIYVSKTKMLFVLMFYCNSLCDLIIFKIHLLTYKSADIDHITNQSITFVISTYRWIVWIFKKILTVASVGLMHGGWISNHDVTVTTTLQDSICNNWKTS